MLTKVVRAAGWTLIAAGVLVLLYLVYLMFFTTLTTDRAQRELLEQWQLEVGDVEGTLPGEDPAGPAVASDEPVDPGDAYAVLWFERPGSDEPLVRDEPLYLVEGVTLDVLRRGPGHYPGTSPPVTSCTWSTAPGTAGRTRSGSSASSHRASSGSSATIRSAPGVRR